MLTTLGLLLSLALPLLGFHMSISCPEGQQCQRALLSGNDVLLNCVSPGAYWDYLLLQEPILITPIYNVSIFFNVETRPEGSLLIKNPRPSQTGLYRCHNESGALRVQFEIDFQDATTLHITHRGLGQEPLENETLNLNRGQFIFTRWEPWQDCNRCGALPGERKRLGFCYIWEPLEEPRPCFSYLMEVRMRTMRMRPELQVEACQVPCKKDRPFNYILFESFELNEESLWLTCPEGSIYRPTYWEANGTLLTWQSQLSGEDFSNVLDPTNGGMRLQIFQPAIYRCFVQQELMARFNPLTPPEMWTLQRDEQEAGEGQNGKAGVVLKGLTLALLAGTVLVLAAVLLKFLRPSWGKRSERVLLVK
ncbi:protein FAM187B isoform X1 [Dasypus novemcinctus]|uniref:protein FAM187B isoform X1 n=1 Tax=Dasypus novemcinctus TaxID=9361 RepID=UPI000328B3C2|nr:protein FAM187B isoform X1 [Dasypus novemcinctus]